MRTDSSNTTDGPAVDRLGGLLERFRVRASLIDAEPLRFARAYSTDPAAPVGHLHVLRAGTVEVVHPSGDPAPARFVVEEPTLILYPGHVPHQLVPGERPDVACAALDFTHGPGHPLVRALPPFVVVPMARVDGLGGALGLLFAEIDQVRCGHRLLADRLLEVVLIQLLRWLFDHPEEAGVQAGLIVGMSDPRIARVLAEVHAAPGDPWTLERMAQTAAMSRSAFAQTFHVLLGQTPATYVADFRISLAQARLRGGEPVSSFAHELGYANASGVSRAFSARTGLSPTAWLAAERRAGDPRG